jgi:rubrerythrin
MDEIGIILTAIVSITALIVFFVMAAALGNISSNLRRVTKVLNDLAKDKGYGMHYTCPDCKTVFEGKLPKCPKCNKEFTYNEKG